MAEVLEEQGFRKAEEGTYIRETDKPEALTLLLQYDDSCLHFRVPCASPLVDCEPEIEDAVRKQAADGLCQKVSFHERMLEMTYSCGDDESRQQAVLAGTGVLDGAAKEFDLLPACMECGRMGRTRAVCHEGRIKTVCGVCADSLTLHISHEKLNERNFEKAKAAAKKRPTTKFLLAGLTAGLWACLMGLLATVVYLAFPLILFGSALAGATAGYLTIRYLRRIYPKVTIHGVILSNLTALLTIVIVSPIDTTLFCKLFELLMFNTAELHNPLTTIAVLNPTPYIFLGLIVMLMTEVMSIFWLPEDVGDI